VRQEVAQSKDFISLNKVKVTELSRRKSLDKESIGLFLEDPNQNKATWCGKSQLKVPTRMGLVMPSSNHKTFRTDEYVTAREDSKRDRNHSSYSDKSS
jgi:hypothetical protein